MKRLILIAVLAMTPLTLYGQAPAASASEPTVATLRVELAQKNLEVAVLKQRVFQLQIMLDNEYKSRADQEVAAAQAALEAAQKAIKAEETPAEKSAHK